MSAVLIIGGTGFIGRHLCIALSDSGTDVVLLTRDKKPWNDGAHPQVRCVTGEFDVDSVIKLVDQYGITDVIHLASSMIPSSNDEQWLIEQREIIAPTLACLPELAKRHVRLVFFSSGGAVYASGAPKPRSESDLCEPISLYGKSKLLLEQHIRAAHESEGLRYLILRPSNPYGQYQRQDGKQGFVTAALKKALTGEPIEIWGDGLVIRDYIYIDDAVRATQCLLDSPTVNETFNISSGTGYSLLQVVDEISRILHRRPEVIHRPGRTVDLPYQVLDRRKLSAFDLQPPRSLTEGIGLYVEALTSHE